jgi:4-hydroxyphenylpyruvate dioxygenase-like putative hemolysin
LRLAEVHLTWRVETDGMFPWTTFYESLDDWRSEQAQP